MQIQETNDQLQKTNDFSSQALYQLAQRMIIVRSLRQLFP